MLSLFKIKKEDSVYPNFSKRMLSSVIDLTLVLFVLSPLWHLLSLVIYAGLSPVKQFRKIVVEAMEQNTDRKALPIIQNQEYIEFINQHGYWPIIQEQFILLFILGSIMLFFWIKYNSTPGKMLLSLHIVNAKNLKKPSIFQLIVRLLSCIISIIPFGIGFITTLFNKEKRAWHDLLSGTVIIKKNTVNINETQSH